MKKSYAFKKQRTIPFEPVFAQAMCVHEVYRLFDALISGKPEPKPLLHCKDRQACKKYHGMKTE